MVKKTTTPKVKDEAPLPPTSFREKLVAAFIAGAISGAPTFLVLQTARNWVIRPAEYRAALKLIEPIERAIEKNERPLTEFSLIKSIYDWSSPANNKISDIVYDFETGRLNDAEREIDKLYNEFKVAIANNRALQVEIQKIKETEPFKKRYQIESKRKSYWWLKGGLFGGGLTAAGFAASPYLQRYNQSRKEKKGNPVRPRRGRRGQ